LGESPLPLREGVRGRGVRASMSHFQRARFLKDRPMSAESDALNQQIEQSVALLRRHL